VGENFPYHGAVPYRPEMGIRDALRQATGPLHAELDAELPDARTHALEYHRLLRTLGSVYLPFEAGIRGDAPLRSAIGDLDRRLRGDALRSDLDTLGLTVPASPALRLDGLGEKLGALYVFEGSTLGGALVCRGVRAMGDPRCLEATRFVSGYGAETGAMWKAFVAQLDGAGLDAEEIERACGAAVDAFAALHAVARELRGQGPERSRSAHPSTSMSASIAQVGTLNRPTSRAVGASSPGGS